MSKSREIFAYFHTHIYTVCKQEVAVSCHSSLFSSPPDPPFNVSVKLSLGNLQIKIIFTRWDKPKLTVFRIAITWEFEWDIRFWQNSSNVKNHLTWIWPKQLIQNLQSLRESGHAVGYYVGFVGLSPKWIGRAQYPMFSPRSYLEREPGGFFPHPSVFLLPFTIKHLKENCLSSVFLFSHLHSVFTFLQSGCSSHFFARDAFDVHW